MVTLAEIKNEAASLRPKPLSAKSVAKFHNKFLNKGYGELSLDEAWEHRKSQHSSYWLPRYEQLLANTTPKPRLRITWNYDGKAISYTLKLASSIFSDCNGYAPTSDFANVWLSKVENIAKRHKADLPPEAASELAKPSGSILLFSSILL